MRRDLLVAAALALLLIGTFFRYTQFAGWPSPRREIALLGLPVFLAPYLLLASRPIVAALGRWAGTRGPRFLVLFLPLAGPGALYEAGIGSFRVWHLLLLLLYLLLPPLCLRTAALPAGLGLRDVAALLLVWLPPHLGLFPGAVYRFMALDATLLLYLVVRGLQGTGYRWSLTRRDVAIGVGSFLAFALVAVPLGTATGFLAFGPQPLDAQALWFRLVAILFVTAIPEEFLFRGVVHTLLTQRLQGWPAWVPLLCSSLLFGLAHFREGDWRYMLLAALAGVFYGWSFIRTGHLMSAVLTHTLVDLAWTGLFTTHWSGRH